MNRNFELACLVLLLILAVNILSASRCSDRDGCDAGDTRCQGDVVQVCDGQQSWQDWIDCVGVSSQTGNVYSCAVDAADGMSSCMLVGKEQGDER